MDGMSVWMSHCITWYNDTSTQMYNNGHIKFQSSSNGCWANVGQISTSSNNPNRINLGNGCIYQMVIEHEVLHASEDALSSF